MIYLKAYVCSLFVFLALDLLWLGAIARSFYASQLGNLMRDDIIYAAAGAFYLAYVAGIVYFAVAPAMAEESWRKAAVNGLLLGLLAYGTYDMTNIATLRDWPVPMSLVDMAWGGAITCATALSGFYMSRVFS